MDDIPSLELVERTIFEREYYEFFLAAWQILEPTTPLINNWHIKYLCDILQEEVKRVSTGKQKTTDLIINIPPRSLKSSIATIFLNAWAWTTNPQLKFIAASYGSDLAIELSNKTRRLLESDFYKRYWKSFKLRDDQNTKEFFENSKHGFRKSIGVGGNITGSGADIILIDDAMNPESAHSESDRLSCVRWFKETLYSRLNNQETGLRVLIQQRLHQEDLTGWIMENQPGLWRIIKLPVSTDFEVQPPELVQNYKDGLFFPDRFPIKIIDEAKKTLGSYGFSGQMGQSPAPIGGGLLKTEWLKTYTAPPADKMAWWSWDCAVKTGQENDYSVGLKLCAFENKFYILDVKRGKWEYPELKRIIQSCCGSTFTHGVIIEDKSSGQQILQDLKRESSLNIIPFISDRDKIMRAGLSSPIMESGRVYIPEQADWLPDFLSELAIFPNGKHDDQVDALTQILLHLNQQTAPAFAFIDVGKKQIWM